MQTPVAELTKQRLSDFFVSEEGHVAHKNALVAGSVATGALLASVLIAPADEGYWCGTQWCESTEDWCVSGQHQNGEWWYQCV